MYNWWTGVFGIFNQKLTQLNVVDVFFLYTSPVIIYCSRVNPIARWFLEWGDFLILEIFCYWENEKGIGAYLVDILRRIRVLQQIVVERKSPASTSTPMNSPSFRYFSSWWWSTWHYFNDYYFWTILPIGVEIFFSSRDIWLPSHCVYIALGKVH